MCIGCLLFDRYCDYTQVDTTQVLPLRCHTKLTIFTARGAVSISRVWRPSASTSPGLLAQSADSQASSKTSWVWHSIQRPQGVAVKQTHQGVCSHLKHKNKVRRQKVEGLFLSDCVPYMTAFYTLIFILPRTLPCLHDYLHLTDKKTEMERG